MSRGAVDGEKERVCGAGDGKIENVRAKLDSRRSTSNSRGGQNN